MYLVVLLLTSIKHKKVMVLTFVMEKPLETDYGRNSSSPEAPLGHTVTGGVRQRRWAPRARTGCLTCRQVQFFPVHPFDSTLYVEADGLTRTCFFSLFFQRATHQV